jgi:hypothetical protein
MLSEGPRVTKYANRLLLALGMARNAVCNLWISVWISCKYQGYAAREHPFSVHSARRDGQYGASRINVWYGE